MISYHASNYLWTHLKIIITVQLDFILYPFIFKSSLLNLVMSVIDFLKQLSSHFFDPMLWIYYFNFTFGCFKRLFHILLSLALLAPSLSSVNAPV